MEEATSTGWHFLGPWTGYYIGAVLTALLVWINKKI